MQGMVNAMNDNDAATGSGYLDRIRGDASGASDADLRVAAAALGSTASLSNFGLAADSMIAVAKRCNSLGITIKHMGS